MRGECSMPGVLKLRPAGVARLNGACSQPLSSQRDEALASKGAPPRARDEGRGRDKGRLTMETQASEGE